MKATVVEPPLMDTYTHRTPSKNASLLLCPVNLPADAITPSFSGNLSRTDDNIDPGVGYYIEVPR